MTKSRFAKRLGFAAIIAMALAAPSARAQQTKQAEPAPKAGKLIRAGDVLSGELNALRLRGGKKGKRAATYQLTSEPRRLPPPNDLCGLETGPETFQIVANSDAQAAQLKVFIGKEVSLKVEEVSCAQDAGQMSEAVVSKWSVVTRH
ncbi:MAG: hypothetical protein WB420_18340 [Bradyrhizobium sp.]|jgi:hypothetical protein